MTRPHELQEQREDLLRTITHDLRGPLTAIQGHAQLLLRLLPQGEVDGRVARSAEAIVASSGRMNAMIQDLVDSVRLEGGQLQLHRRPVHLGPLVSDLLERMAEPMESGRVRVEIPAGLPPVDADPSRVERMHGAPMKGAPTSADPSRVERILANL